MRDLTQLETRRISGSLGNAQLIEMLVFSLSFIGYCYHFFHPVDVSTFNQDFSILPITLTVSTNISI